MPVQRSDAVEGAVCCLDLLLDCLSTKVRGTHTDMHTYYVTQGGECINMQMHPVVPDLRWFSSRRLGVRH